MNPVDHDQWMQEKLQDPEFALEFLNAARDDEDPRVYQMALDQVIEAQGLDWVNESLN